MQPSPLYRLPSRVARAVEIAALVHLSTAALESECCSRLITPLDGSAKSASVVAGVDRWSCHPHRRRCSDSLRCALTPLLPLCLCHRSGPQWCNHLSSRQVTSLAPPLPLHRLPLRVPPCQWGSQWRCLYRRRPSRTLHAFVVVGGGGDGGAASSDGGGGPRECRVPQSWQASTGGLVTHIAVAAPIACAAH